MRQPKKLDIRMKIRIHVEVKGFSSKTRIKKYAYEVESETKIHLINARYVERR
jgi:hypothetical protein